MFISHFNRYFEKHAKLTYFVLLVIIIATFVIFVTPGSMNGGNQRGIKDFGEMYGKTLSVELMQKEMAKTTLSLWISNPQFFGADFSSQKTGLFQETLNRMRVLHYAKEKGLDKVTDDEIRARIQKIELIQENGVFSKTAFENLIETVKGRLGMLPVEFDQVVREMVIMERVMEDIRGRVAVSDSDVDDMLALFTLKSAVVGISAKDAEPTEEDIQKFFAERKAEIKLPESKSALAAIFQYDAVRAAMGTAAVPTAAEIEQRYNANKNTIYKEQTLEQATDAIREALSGEKVRATARTKAMDLSKAFQNMVQDESQDARQVRFAGEAVKAGASITETGVVSLDNVISGLGVQERLADAIRRVPELGGVTSLIVADKYAAVAMVTAAQATQMPDALPELKATVDPLRRIISEAIIREKALAFFTANVKTPYDNFMTQAEALKNDKSMSAEQKQQALYMLQGTMDSQLVMRFYIPEQRSFAQVTFAPEAYADQVVAATEEEIAAAFEAKKDTDYKDKALADVKETIAADLKAAAARKLADEAAAQFAEKYSTAFWAAKDANADTQGDVLLEKMAGEVAQAKFERILKLDVTRANASNSEVLYSVFQATLTSPVAGPVIGLDASYVICLTGIEEAKLADPATSAEYYRALEQSYRQNMEMAAAEKRAQDEVKRMTDALAANGNDFAAAAGELKFAELPAFSVNDIYNQTEAVKEFQKQSQVSPVSFVNELSKLKAAGAFLAPQKAQQVFGQGIVLPIGYQVIYVADRKVVEKTDANAAECEKIKAQLLATKQNEELNNFFQTLIEQSGTELRMDTPYTSAE